MRKRETQSATKEDTESAHLQRVKECPWGERGGLKGVNAGDEGLM